MGAGVTCVGWLRRGLRLVGAGVTCVWWAAAWPAVGGRRRGLPSVGGGITWATPALGRMVLRS